MWSSRRACRQYATPLIIAAVGMPLGGFYGVLVGYLIARRRFPGRQAMEMVSMINYALPGTIVGIAYLVAFNDPPLALSGGALIIIACYVFRYSPTGIRATVALLEQIDRSIEEASASLGAGSGVTFRRVTLPLIAPAFFAGLGVVFIRSMTAISATIFLVSLSWTLITVRILENMTELALGPAAAFSIFVIVVVFVVVAALSALLMRLRTPAAGAAARSLLGGLVHGSDQPVPNLKHFDHTVKGGVYAVRDVSLHVADGELLTLLGTIRVRQVDDVAHDCGLRTARRRRDLDRRPRRHTHAAESARHRLRVPELCAVPASLDLRERRLRSSRAGQEQGRDRSCRGRGARTRRPRQVRTPTPPSIVGRRTTACGVGPGRGVPAHGIAVRRAAEQPRRQAARGDARTDPGFAEAHRHHHGLCHARPGRSDGDLGTGSPSWSKAAWSRPDRPKNLY